jgi:hypothetical protein
MKGWGVVVAQFVMFLGVGLAHAGGLGVTGDGFITSFITWVPTILFLAMLCGIVIWLGSSNDHGQGILAGATALSTRGVIGGGALAILAALGFTQGALLN